MWQGGKSDFETFGCESNDWHPTSEVDGKEAVKESQGVRVSIPSSTEAGTLSPTWPLSAPSPALRSLLVSTSDQRYRT